MSPLETAQALIAAWETRDVGTTARLLADDFILTGPSPAALGRDAYLGFQAIHNEAFPDWKFNVQQAEVNNGKVRFTIQITATHTGPYDVSKLGVPIPPIAPTGKSRSWPVEHMRVTVKEGRVRQIEVENEPGGGVVGTLEWLGVDVPAPAL